MSIAVQSAVAPRRPAADGWTRIHGVRLPLEELGFPYEIWMHRESGLGVINALEVAVDPGQPSLGPEWHLSVSLGGERCTSDDAQWVLGQFDLTDAKEDNHVPSGRVRNFWRPVADPLAGIECKCVDDEPAVREDKGDYVWRGVSA